MIDMHRLEKSKKLYEEAKAYFVSQDITECVIEISDKPVSEWVVHFTRTKEGMRKKRVELVDAELPYIAIYNKQEEKYFFFTDSITRSLELLGTNNFIYFHTIDFDKKQVIKEFLELKKMLQGS